MSLLLDALNKADEERKRNESAPGISSNHNAASPHSDHTRSILVIVAIIVIGLIILLASVYWLGKQTSSAPAPATEITSAKLAEPAQKVAPKTQTFPQTTKQSTTQASTAAVTSQAPANSANTAETAPEENVADLYQQNDSANIEAQNSNSQTDTTNPTSINQFANLQEIRDLPNNVLERIPSLNYTEHNYNANGGNVVINGNVRHPNDQLANGLVIDKILQDGMILHFENYAFKMRALNSWVNM